MIVTRAWGWHGGWSARVRVQVKRLIEQAAAQHAQLIEIQNELKPLFARTGDARKEAIHGGLPETAPLA
jgi:hypothetical protein